MQRSIIRVARQSLEVEESFKILKFFLSDVENSQKVIKKNRIPEEKSMKRNKNVKISKYQKIQNEEITATARDRRNFSLEVA
jgi:hypothetical protein